MEPNEKTTLPTHYSIFIRYFKWKKSTRNAEIASDGNTVYYVIVCLIVFIYDVYKHHVKFSFLNVIFWLIIMTMLALIFHKLYAKYQGLDPTKADDDYS